MRAKIKVSSREEIMKNFTREFLVEEKRRCEIDRYITDFRILIHKRPHENHNYLNRLLQDYTSMFLSHERISTNKSNEDEMKYQMKKQLTSKMKNSPKQRYVKSKSSEKNTQHQSYLVLKAKTEEFLRKLRDYEKLEQVAYEIFSKHFEKEIVPYPKIKNSQYTSKDIYEQEHTLKLKSAEFPDDIPYKKYYKNVYVVNSPTKSQESRSENLISVNHEAVNENSVESSKKSTRKSGENPMESYDYIKNETMKFMENNRNHNDAERKIMSEQYQNNLFIRKYVDILNSPDIQKKLPSSPKKGFLTKIRNMIGFSPETPSKFYKNLENENQIIIQGTENFLKNERKYNNFEFEAYKLFYIKHGDVQNPLIEKIEEIAHISKAKFVHGKSPGTGKKIKIKHLIGLKNIKSNTPDHSPDREEFQNFNVIKCSPNGDSMKSGKIIEKIEFTFDENISPNERKEGKHFKSEIQGTELGTHVKIVPDSPNDSIHSNVMELDQKKKSKILRKQTEEFLHQQKIYDDQQRKFDILFSEKHPVSFTKEIAKKETLLSRIKQLFKFGKNDRSGEKSDSFREVTYEFLKNEQYYCNSERKALLKFSMNYSGQVRVEEKFQDKKETELSLSKTDLEKSKNYIFVKEKQNVPPISPSHIYQRSRSEDLLTLKTKTKSLDSVSRKSPTYHKSLSDRLKRMVGIGGRKSKSRENILSLTDPVQYFLDHERFNYDIDPEMEKYGRNVSFENKPNRSVSMTTSTRKFLSTENILYQDQTDGVTKKPPSGRRRKETRDDNDKKKRSRTLSPAQKLVSKFRNIVHRDGKKKRDAIKNWEFLKNETQKFLLDHKRFNDLQQDPTMKTPSNIENGNINIRPSRYLPHENKELKTVSENERRKKEDVMIHKQIVVTKMLPQAENTSKALVDYEVTKNLEKIKQTKMDVKLDNAMKPVNAAAAMGTGKIDPFPNSYDQYRKAPSEINKAVSPKGTNIFDDQEFIKSQTRVFLHETKKYHDLDREPSTVDKTIIFVNNKINAPYDQLPLKSQRTVLDKPQIISTSQSTSASNSPQNKPIPATRITKNTTQQIRQNSSTNLVSRNNEEIRNSESEHKSKTIENKVISSSKIENKIIKKETKIINRTIVSNTIRKEYVSGSSLGEKEAELKERITAIPRNLNSNIIEQKRIDQSLSKKESFSSDIFRDTAKIIHEEEGKEVLKQGTDEETFPKKPGKHPVSSNSREPHKLDDETERSVLLNERQIIPKDDLQNIQPDNVPKIESASTNGDSEQKISRSMAKETDLFLKNHQDYHNMERKEHNNSTKIIKNPDQELSLASKETEEKKNIITKMKRLLSPKQSKKHISPVEKEVYKYMMDQTAEFLRYHQYLIYKEEVDFTPRIHEHPVVTENVIISRNNPEKESTEGKIEKVKELPSKNEKPKKGTYSKLKSFMNAKEPSRKEKNILLKKQTEEFLNDLKKYENIEKQALMKYNVVWLKKEKVLPLNDTEALKTKGNIENIPTSADQEYNHKMFEIMKTETNLFLKNHQDYHNKQRIEDNNFLEKAGGLNHNIWLSSRATKEKKNIITKVKDLLSPHRSNKNIPSEEMDSNKFSLDLIAEFLRKQQYFIHEDEVQFRKQPISANVAIAENQIVPKLTPDEPSAISKTEPVTETPRKDNKSKKGAFSKFKSLINNTTIEPTAKESNAILKKQTEDFLNNLRKHDDIKKEAEIKYKIIWLNEQTPLPMKHLNDSQTKSTTTSIDRKFDHDSFLRIKKATNSFLEDHQDYHNRQRNEDNDFFSKIGKPEHDIWLSSRVMKKKKNIITKVKDLLSPHRSNKNIPSAEMDSNKFSLDLIAEFLRKQQYFIHEDEVQFKKHPTSANVAIAENQIEPKLIQGEHSAIRKTETVTETPIKDNKSKKGAFSKFKSLINNTTIEPTAKESNEILKKQTEDFLNNLRKHDDIKKEAEIKYKIIWLNEQNLLPMKQLKDSQTKSIATSIDQKFDHNSFLRVKKATNSFLQDHQDYHNRQRNEDNDFFSKIGKPEDDIWLSSRVMKKKRNIITKVKDLLSPHRSRKNIPTGEIDSNKFSLDLIAEFLRKQQYFIHEDEVQFRKQPISANVNVAENQILPKLIPEEHSAIRKTETVTETPMKDYKSKKGAFSKFKSLINNTTIEPTAKESNEILKKQTEDFLNNLRKHDDIKKEDEIKYKIIWLNEQNLLPMKQLKDSQTKSVATSIDKKFDHDSFLRIKKATNSFLKDHQDYHNRQRNEDNDFFSKIGKPEHDIWLSSRVTKKKKNIITKVKDLLSPHRSRKNIPTVEIDSNKFSLDLIAEFLSKQQYFIHEDEVQFTKQPISANVDVVENQIVPKLIPEEHSAVLETETVTETPIKDDKSKKGAFSKFKSLINNTTIEPSAKESNEILKKQTEDFLNNLRKHDDIKKEAEIKYKIIWLNKQTPLMKHLNDSQTKSPTSSIDKKSDHDSFLRIKKATNSFLQDHQDYHNRQRNEDNDFFSKIGKPEHDIWLSSRVMKKKKNIITKVKDILSPHRSRKNIPTGEIDSNKLSLDLIAEFLRKQQYFIHEDEVRFRKQPISANVAIVENQIVPKLIPEEHSAIRETETVTETPMKDNKSKKGAFSKFKSLINNTTIEPTAKESNEILKKQTEDFLNNLRKHDDIKKEDEIKYKIIWLNEQTPLSIKHLNDSQTKSTTTSIDKKFDHDSFLRIKKATNSFLKDHQGYHNRQRNEDNNFFSKIGKPEHDIWLSSRVTKKKKNIITKVKDLLSPHRSNKNIPSAEMDSNKFSLDLIAEFLRKQQYFIHEDEVQFRKQPISPNVVIAENEIVPKLIPEEHSAIRKTETVTETPMKDDKSKKGAFSKFKSLINNTTIVPTAKESNAILKKQTEDFLNNLRKHDDIKKEAEIKYKIIWLNEQTPLPMKHLKDSQTKSTTTSIDKKFDHDSFLRIKKATNSFLKDHQDYHNRQRNEDHDFFSKIGKPEHDIWLSSRVMKKKKNIITKVKDLLSPHRTRKNIPTVEIDSNKFSLDLIAKFLRKQQYFIHEDEVQFRKQPISANVVIAENQIMPKLIPEEHSAIRKTETVTETPIRDNKSKKGAFSKFKSLINNTTIEPTAKESNEILKKQTEDFLNNLRKYDDIKKEAEIKYKIIWLNEQTPLPMKHLNDSRTKSTSTPIDKKFDHDSFLRIKKATNSFLQDHQDYHNRQRNEDNDFFSKIGKPEDDIWLSSRVMKKKKNIITKVKDLLSPHRSRKNIPTIEMDSNKFSLDLIAEFLRKQQYFIHEDEVQFSKQPISANVVIAENQIGPKLIPEEHSAIRKTEPVTETPMKDNKSKKGAFSKFKSLINNTTIEPTAKESNEILKKQTEDFLNNLRKHDDIKKEAEIKYKIIWLNEQTALPMNHLNDSQTKSTTTSIDKKFDHDSFLRIKKATNSFLKDHQDYHNRQRNEDNEFFSKIGKPESDIWLSSRVMKKKKNLITKVKDLLSPHRSDKNIPTAEIDNNKFSLDLIAEFLRKQQYFIHEDEVRFRKQPISANVAIAENQVVPKLIPEEYSAIRETETVTETPMKDNKSKKGAFSKFKSLINNTTIVPTAKESNALLKKQTEDFLNNLRKHDDIKKEAEIKYKIIWLNEQTPLSMKHLNDSQTKSTTTSIDKKFDHDAFLRIKKATNSFLKDHQDYHNRQRNEDNNFFSRIGRPEHDIWLSSRVMKKKKNIIFKVKDLLSPHRSNKNISSAEMDSNKLSLDLFAEFLRKQQYFIHEDEVQFRKQPISANVVIAENQIVPKVIPGEHSAIRETETVTETPIEDNKSKKGAFSKFKTLINNTTIVPTAKESNALLKKQTEDFLNNLRKHDDIKKEAEIKYKIIWLNEQTPLPMKHLNDSQTKSTTTSIDKKFDHDSFLRIKKATNSFLKDHQDYHNRQRNEDNNFFSKIGKPEHDIWLSSRVMKKKKNIITKVKDLLSPHRSKKIIPTSEIDSNKFSLDLIAEFLRKQQYFIHEDEVQFRKQPISANVVIAENKIVSKLITGEPSAIRKTETVTETPIKDNKSKKGAFSKFKSLVNNTNIEPTARESNEILKKQTEDFLNNLRKYDDINKEAEIKYKIIWLNEQTPLPMKQLKDSQTKSTTTSIDKKFDHDSFLRIKKATNSFLEDHQDYHNRQRNEDNEFFSKIGKPEDDIWLSSRVMKKKKNIITKVKDLLSPHRSRKNIPTVEIDSNKFSLDLIAEFLRKQQYFIHEDEVRFRKQPISANVVIAENQIVSKLIPEEHSALRKTETVTETPMKNNKSKKGAFSKFKSLINNTTIEPTAKESNEILKKQTEDFLNNLRKYDDINKETEIKYKIIWLNEQTPLPMKHLNDSQTKSTTTSIDKKFDHDSFLRIKKATNSFLKDHQDYHNRQRNEDNEFFSKIGKPEDDIWLSSRVMKKKKNIITKVKDLLPPHRSNKNISSGEMDSNKFSLDLISEFLRKQQYFIHEDELRFRKQPISANVVISENQIVPKLIPEEHSAIRKTKTVTETPMKNNKSKNGAFSKLKSLINNTTIVPTAKESNEILKKQTEDFLNNLRKYDDIKKEAEIKYKIIWLNEQTQLPMKHLNDSQTKSPTTSIDKKFDHDSFLRIKKATNSFLKDHQDYHNRQRNEDNDFFSKIGKPEHDIWLSSRRFPEQKSFMTRLKDSLTSPHSKKILRPKEVESNKYLQNVTTEFLRKHQYLIHRDEIEYCISPISTRFNVTENAIVPKNIPGEESAIHTFETIKESPPISKKSKIGTFSKLKTFMTGTNKLNLKERYELNKRSTQDFLNNLKKWEHTEREASAKYNIVWLDEQEIIPKKDSYDSQKESTSKSTNKKINHDISFMITKENIAFLKDHQNYHNIQRSEHDDFLRKYGKTESEIWLSSGRKKEKKNKFSKVNSLLSPKNSKTIASPKMKESTKLLQNQTAEFLLRLKYFIHKEEIDINKLSNSPLSINTIDEDPLKRNSEEQLFEVQKVKSVEKPLKKDEKLKKSAFSKIKSFMSSAPKLSAKENRDLLRKQTQEFLNNLRRYEDSENKTLNEKERVILNEHKIIAMKRLDHPPPRDVPEIGVSSTKEEDEYEKFLLMKQQTSRFMEDHKEYHNQEKIEHKKYLEQPKTLDICQASKSKSDKGNIITKVKNLWSPSKTVQNAVFYDDVPEYENVDDEIGAVSVSKDDLFKEERTKIPVNPTTDDDIKNIDAQGVIKIPQQKQTQITKKKVTFLEKQILSQPGPHENILSKEKSEQNNRLLKQQTSEFLISQKCYNDLEGEAALKFTNRQSEQHKPQAAPRKTKVKEKAATEIHRSPEELYQSKRKNEPIISKEVPEEASKKTILEQGNQSPTEELVNRKDFIAFSSQGKQLYNESPAANIPQNQSKDPLNSSIKEKKIMMADASKVKSDSVSSKPKNKMKTKPIVDFTILRKDTQNFLDTQRSYIDSEKEAWKHYVKYKPEVAMVERVSLQNQSNTLRVSSQKRKPSSQIESETIDYEVTFYKTKMFLEDHKNYHNNERDEFNKYVPKPRCESIGEVRDKKESVLTKLRSLLPTGQSKNRSYDIQAAKSTKRKEDNEAERDIVSKKYCEYKVESIPVKKHEVSLTEKTKLFLRDHQDYHNKERCDTAKYFSNFNQAEAKTKTKDISLDMEKKTKKGIMSKLKSLVKGDQLKTPSLNESNNLLKKQTESFVEDCQRYSHLEKSAEDTFMESRGKFVIKELESSPISYKRIRVAKELPKLEDDRSYKQLPEKNTENIEMRKDTLIPKDLISSSEKSTKSEKNYRSDTSLNEHTDKPINTIKVLPNSKGQTLQKLSYSQIQTIPEDERRRYAQDKIKTQEFLLNQKQFSDDMKLKTHSPSITSKPPKTGEFRIQPSELSPTKNTNESFVKKSNENNHNKALSTTETIVKDATMERNVIDKGEINVPNEFNEISSNFNCRESNLERETPKRSITGVMGKTVFLPSAPPSLDQCEQLSEEEKKIIESSLIHRVVNPKSPTKTVFKEIRTRENSPDRRIYILSEGYTITKEPRGNIDIKVRDVEANNTFSNTKDTLYENVAVKFEQKDQRNQMNEKQIESFENLDRIVAEELETPIPTIPSIQENISNVQCFRRSDPGEPTSSKYVPSVYNNSESRQNELFLKLHNDRIPEKIADDLDSFMAREKNHDMTNNDDVGDRTPSQMGRESARGSKETSPFQRLPVLPEGGLEVRKQHTSSCYLTLLIIVLVIIIAMYLGRSEE